MAWEVTSVDDGAECLVRVDGFPFKVAAQSIKEHRERAFEIGLARFLDSRLKPYGGAQDLAAAMLARWREIQPDGR